MAINLSRLVTSSMLNAQTLTVYRSVGGFVAGRWVEQVQNPPTIDISGIAYPSSEKELNQVPEGDRIKGAITFLTAEKLNATHVEAPSGVSDKVEWNGELYKVVSLLPWGDYGYYASVCERISGE